jgi:serine/threonine-protein kinase
MAACRSCSAEVHADARFCFLCGAPVDVSSDDTVRRPPSPRPSSSSDIDHGRFVPGTIFGSRYRIVALLGRGGMGEVYRADDMKLGQSVALKLLPKQIDGSAEHTTRLLREVRIARQITHPNVCRVYDVGETDGEHFITMEYVHGEDLASLIHRIGRLPKDKAIEIGRQICAGLAAAHARGILHRDLKPANIMLDDQGNARITDFGLAVAAGDPGNAAEGTPAYRAPEQLAGREVTARSDIYALGLVLYEIFTGRRPFNARTLSELREARQQRSMTDPSRVVDDIDPAVERVILRCLENDPRDRPQTILSVIVAFSGRDPLAAALAAGETPSPELLAAAGDSVGLRPSIAAALLAFVLLGSVVDCLFQMRNNLTGYVNVGIPPEVLALRARETIRQLGYPQKAADSAHGFQPDLDFLSYVRTHDKSPRRWERLRSGRPPSLLFWYRESNEPLEWQSFYSYGVTRSDPPPTRSGMKDVSLDPSGRLVSFSAVPDQIESGAAHGVIDWETLFIAAGLDPSQFKQTLPQWLPPSFADTRMAWESKLPSAEPLRIEAAAYHGKPVYFQMIGPWTRPSQMKALPVTEGEKVAQAILAGVFVMVLLGGILIARRNVSLGRGDRRGATRLAMAVFFALIASRVIITTHVATSYELGIMVMHLCWALFSAGLMWVLYLALEPYLRRRWPHALIASGKVLAGRLRDPLVGRDVLIGCAAGVVLGLLFSGIPLLTRLLGGVTSAPSSNLDPLSGFRFALGFPLFNGVRAVFDAFVAIFLLFALRVVLRKDWFAVAAVAVIGSIVMIGQGDNFVASLFLGVIAFTVIPLVMIRFGLLTAFCMVYVSDLFDSGITDFTSWSSYSAWIPMAVIAMMAAMASYTSLAGRPLIPEALFES